MAEIEKPGNFFGEAVSVSTLLEQLRRWQQVHPVSARDPLRRIWYRGHSNHEYKLWPGVYREDFHEGFGCLTALFFAVQENKPPDGEPLIIDAHTLPPKEPDAPRSIVTMRNPYAVDAIGISFWHEPKRPRKALVLPIRPDNQYGRIGMQSSCFTLHMHQAKPCKNDTLERVKIPRAAKSSIFDELRRLNINEFTVYNDLDHLAKHIKRTWMAQQ